MKQVNVFHKGIVADLDNTLVPNDSWVFPTMNARIVNLGGKGFVVQNIDGSKQLFNLGTRNIPLGAVEHNGILYIAFMNLDVQGQGSIGSYPSPETWAVGNSELVNEFKVLKNFILTGETTPSDLTTTRFNFNILNKLRIKAKTSYDGTVELYFADGVNPLRVVNSGFKSDGTVVNRYINEADFDSFVNVIQSTANVPRFGFKPFGQGDLLNGNYFVFVRYVTDDFNNTEFLSESFAFSLYQETSDNNAFAEGGISAESSGQSINFTLDNIDTSYKFLEFALIRYFGDNAPTQYESYLYNEYFTIIGESMSINLAYNDRMVAFPEEEILKPRNRDICPKDIEYFDNTLWGANWREKDRFHQVLKEYASRVMIFPRTLSVGDIAYNDVNIDFNASSDITIKYYRPGDVYEDPKYIYENTGYFRGETYAFGLIYGFKDGDITDGYPTAGRDDYDNTTCYQDQNWEDYDDSTKFNQDGFYRTPKADLICDDDEDKYQLLKNNDRRLLYLKFDFTEANRWLNEDATEDEKEWLMNNIKSCRIARDERKQNLITQGLSLSLIKPTGTINSILGEYNRFLNYVPIPTATSELALHLPDDNNWDDSDLEDLTPVVGRLMQGSPVSDYEVGKDYKFPYYKGIIPMWGQMTNDGLAGAWTEFTSLAWCVSGVAVPNEYGIYSPDFIYDRAMSFGEVNYIKRVARNINTIDPDTNLYEGLVGAGYWQDVYPEQPLIAAVDYSTVERESVQLENKATPLKGNETVINGGGFDSRCIALAFDINDEKLCHFWHTSTSGGIRTTFANRNINSLPYIAIKQDASDTNSDVYEIMDDNDFIAEHTPLPETISHNLDIVNLYASRPEDLDIFTWYNKQYLRYKPITDFIDFTLNGEDIELIETIDAWRGDCFLNRSTMNIYGWTNSECQSGNNGEKFVGDAINDAQTGKYGWDWADWMTSVNHIKYAHGITVSIVTENKHNAAYRFHNRYGQNTYWDREVGGGAQSSGLNWLIRCWKNTTRESLLYNTGNSKVLSEKTSTIYPYLEPYNGTTHPTRIRYSNRHTPGAFLDANRQFEVMHYKDFDFAFGQINALYEHNNILVSIQNSSINRHFVNEKALSIGADGNELLLGSAAEYLSLQTQQIGDFGSKHQWSTIKTPNGIYGIDFARNIIWKTGSIVNGNNIAYQAEDITINRSVQSWLKDVYDVFNSDNNPLKILKDTPANGEGIITGYDALNKEVLFTFMYYTQVGFTDEYDKIILEPTNKSTYINSIYKKYYVASWNDVIYYSLIGNNHYPTDNSLAWKSISYEDMNANYFSPGIYYEGNIVWGDEANKFYLVVVTKDTNTPVSYITELFDLDEVVLPNGESAYHRNYIQFELKYLKKHNKTLVFSEKINAFTSEYSFYPIFYALLENMMFSSVNNSIHIHNQADRLQLFHGGKIEEFMISFVVSGKASENDATMFFKYFCSLDIEITDVVLKQINYKTDLQEGVYMYSRNSDEFWKDAEYFEGKLKAPIYVQTDPDTEWEDNSLEFYEGSDMKGTYLVVTLVYKPVSDVKKITLRNAITNFNISQS